MNWEEIIISALKNKDDLDLTLKKAAKVAPKEIAFLLETFPREINGIEKKLNMYPKTLSLLYFHFFAMRGEYFYEFPVEKHKNILKTSINASINASFISGKLNEKALVAQYLIMAGNSSFRLGEFSQAEKFYSEALEKYENLENPEAYTLNIAKTLNNLGSLSLIKKRFSQAEKFYSEALEKYRNLSTDILDVCRPDFAGTLANLGSLYKNTGKFAEAEKAFTEALEVRRNLAEDGSALYIRDVVATLNNLGVIYYYTQRFSKAEEAYREATEIIKLLAEQNPEGYAPVIAETLNNLGNLYAKTGKSLQAEKSYTEALKNYRGLEKANPEVYMSYTAMTLTNLGNIHCYTRKLFQAEQVYTEALKKYRRLAKENPEVYTRDVATVLSNLGNLYQDIGKFDGAERFYTEALKKYRGLEKANPEAYAPYVAETLNNIGNLYNDTRKFSEIEEFYTGALEKYRGLAEQNPEVYTPDVAKTLTNLGNFYWNMGKFDEAEKACREALEIRRILAKDNPDVYTRDVAATLNNFGALYWNMGKFDEAEEFYTEALEKYKILAKRNPQIYVYHIYRTLNGLGVLYRDAKKFSQAEKTYTEALEMRMNLAGENKEAHTRDVAMMLNNLGALYSNTQKFAEAGNMYKEALKKYMQVASWFDAVKVVYNLSLINHDKKIVEESRNLLEMAILFSKEEKYRYVQKWSNENIYLSLFEQDVNPFGILEALRDPNLLSLSWSRIISKKELERTQKDVEFQKKVVEKFLRKPISPIKIPVELPENIIFMYIQKIEDSLFFFTVKNGDIEKFKGKREFFTIGIKLLYLLRFQLKAAGKPRLITHVEKFDELARKWYEILPPQLKKLIQEKSQIIFSPDYYCSFFPLEALQVNGQSLCMEKTVVRATSLHQCLTLSKKDLCFDSSFIVGNPWPNCNEKELIYSSPSNSERFRIPFLNGAEEEAKALAEKLPNTTVLLKQQATGERFLSEVSKHSLIHFCGHGRLGRILFLCGPLQGFPPQFEPKEFSDLRKAERSEGIKKVNVMEEWHPVTDLDLFNVKLTDGAVVFLNACETGQHKYAGGGYYQGLPAVFLKNGAHSIISSLVPIFDNPSKEFAVTFYETLLHTQSVSESLKKTRIWSKNKYKAQIYWVPYIHYGSPA